MSEYTCPCGCGGPDDCAPGCRVKRVRWVCPHNGTYNQRPCPKCSSFHAHIREELAPVNRIPKCELHGDMIPA